MISRMTGRRGWTLSRRRGMSLRYFQAFYADDNRLALLCFMWDTQHAVLFCQSLCMSAFELRSNLPCDQSLWEADSAETWHQLRQKQPPTPLFLSCLKMYLHPNATAVPKNLNNLSRSLLLHGLMSVAWDMQRRDQTSLGDPIAANPLGNWQSRLASSYTAWHADYETFCNTYTDRLPSQDHFLAKEFQVMRSATLALYHPHTFSSTLPSWTSKSMLVRGISLSAQLRVQTTHAASAQSRSGLRRTSKRPAKPFGTPPLSWTKVSTYSTENLILEPDASGTTPGLCISARWSCGVCGMRALFLLRHLLRPIFRLFRYMMMRMRSFGIRPLR